MREEDKVIIKTPEEAGIRNSTLLKNYGGREAVIEKFLRGQHVKICLSADKRTKFIAKRESLKEKSSLPEHLFKIE